jgi:hypothetical protein
MTGTLRISAPSPAEIINAVNYVRLQHALNAPFVNDRCADP